MCGLAEGGMLDVSSFSMCKHAAAKLAALSSIVPYDLTDAYLRIRLYVLIRTAAKKKKNKQIKIKTTRWPRNKL